MRNRASIARPLILLAAVGLALSGCAWLQHTDPPHVTVVGMEPAGAGEGFEARMQLKLRVQNSNAEPIAYNGIYVELDVQDKSFATGVSNQSGTVPAFGEAVITVPMTVSAFAIAGQTMGLFTGKSLDKVTYVMQGKLNSTSGALRFKSQGELNVADFMSGTR
ncbi:MAG TPA: LEA type 2 family protein [Steroidobacteraceae bacterium]|nr:LEA type 2 family protein [Steroidobacteraceae bacterium]